jgi:hypothetical protein
MSLGQRYEKTGRERGTDGNNGTNEILQTHMLFFRLFRYFRLFRALSASLINFTQCHWPEGGQSL